MRGVGSRRSGRGSDGARDRGGEAVPGGRLGFDLAAAGAGQAIEFRPAAVGRFPPERGEPAFVFEPVQRGEKRAGLDVEGALRRLTDPPADCEAMLWSRAKDSQDEEVESASKEF